MRAIFASSPDAAIQIGRRVAGDLSSVPEEHARFLSELATMILKAGDADEAVDTAILAAQTERLSRGSSYIANPRAATTMVDVFADSGRPERADDVLETLDFLDHGGDDDNETTVAYRQVLRSGVLALCDRGDEAAALLDVALPVLNEGFAYLYRLELAAPRRRERALFAATRRGGSVRLLGLLRDDDALNTPAGLMAILSDEPYFRNGVYEQSVDRVIVDLPEFSLDFQWHSTDEAIQAVRNVYDNFRFEDRRHIPTPRQNVANALMVLAAGDDLTEPDIVNPMIELSCLLDDQNECVFYNRAGPLSREETLPEIERVDTRSVEKAIRSQVKPMLVQGGFEASSTRRYDMDSGRLGHYAVIHFRIDADLTVESYAAIYYRELMQAESITRYTNKKGAFRPKPNLIWDAQYESLPSQRWKCTEPTEHGLQEMIEQILRHLKAVIIPRVAQSANPRQEVDALVQSGDDLTALDARPKKNRFGASTMDEILGHMADLLDD